MFERATKGFFIRDMMIFNHLPRGGYVSKGFIFEAPDLTNSPVADLNDFQDQTCLLLASLYEHQRLQVQYYCDSLFPPRGGVFLPRLNLSVQSWGIYGMMRPVEVSRKDAFHKNGQLEPWVDVVQLALPKAIPLVLVSAPDHQGCFTGLR